MKDKDNLQERESWSVGYGYYLVGVKGWIKVRVRIRVWVIHHKCVSYLKFN